MSRFRVSILANVFILVLAGRIQVLGQVFCYGKYKGGLKPSAGELTDILKKHTEWISEGGLTNPKLRNDPRRANLCGANLSSANLEGQNLSKANLSDANLERTHLTGTTLIGANLNNADIAAADLTNANLTGADVGEARNVNSAYLDGADLTGAGFIRANLSKANLNQANLNNAHLSDAHIDGAHLNSAHLINAELMNADLSGADLTGAHLNGAYLFYAHLTGADLSSADLTGCHLNGADLNHANLTFANLGRVDLTGANLNAANLEEANLAGVNLQQAKLKDAYMSNTDVAGAFLDCDPDSLPRLVPGLYSAHNLQLVKFHDQPAALVKLRAEFKDLGLRFQESQLTCAIRRGEVYQLVVEGDNEQPRSRYVRSRAERLFNLVIFDWTCQYGMSPGRPLLLVAGFSFFFTILYVIVQCFPKLGGIWVVWEEGRIDKTKESDVPQRLTGFPYDPSARPRSRLRLFLSVVMLAAYFSLLSAVRIGWSGLNFGTWISRMQLREYSLHATGWVRLTSGLQSLISVLLIALSILTYFGTPFEY